LLLISRAIGSSITLPLRTGRQAESFPVILSAIKDFAAPRKEYAQELHLDLCAQGPKQGEILRGAQDDRGCEAFLQRPQVTPHRPALTW
jgi:hypothetical protein